MKISARSPRYNKLKKRALEVFANHGGWLTAREWAILADFYPIRAAYSYLLRLHRFGLLARCYRKERISYNLTPRGLDRLAWLEERFRISLG